jgi:protein TonB
MTGLGRRPGLRFEIWLLIALAAHVALLRSARALQASPSVSAHPPVEFTVERAAPPPPPKPPPPPPPEPEPEPVRAPVPPPPRPPPPEPTAPPPPPIAERLNAAAAAAVAEASKILTSLRSDDDAPSIATGNADKPTYGLVAGAGTGTVTTFDRRARIGGRPGGTGSGEDPGPDRSRKAQAFAGYTDDCAFPNEAEAKRIDHGLATLLISIRPDGRASRVVVLGDSGYGFGEAARVCAMKYRHQAARDRSGKAIDGEAKINFRFTR